MFALIKRALLRFHHLGLVRDCTFAIDHHESLLARLPAEIQRLKEVRKFHVGRIDTVSSPRNVVNLRLGRSSRR